MVRYGSMFGLVELDRRQVLRYRLVGPDRRAAARGPVARQHQSQYGFALPPASRGEGCELISLSLRIHECPDARVAQGRHGYIGFADIPGAAR